MTDQKQTILFVNLYTEMGGGEQTIYYLLKELDRTRFEPLMMFNGEGAFVKKVSALGIRTIVLPYPTVMLRELIHPVILWKVFTASKEITKVIRNQRINIIHCNDVLSLLLVAIPVLRGRIPVLFSVIFFYEWSRAMLFNILALALVRTIVTNSLAVRNDLLGKTMFLETKIETIHPGVDPSLVHPLKSGEQNVVRSEMQWNDEVRLVGMVGRFDRAKGQHIFLQMASMLLQERSDLRFVLVGGLVNADAIPSIRAYHEEVRMMHSAMGLGDRVRFLDQRTDIGGVIRSLDVLVCPSLSEGFGLVVLEALASGIPVVASKTVGAVEVVKDERNVFLAEPGKADSFAAAVLQSVDLTKNRNGQPEQFVDEFVQRFRWDQYARGFEDVYLEMTN